MICSHNGSDHIDLTAIIEYNYKAIHTTDVRYCLINLFLKGSGTVARELTSAQLIERSIIKKYRGDIWNKFVMALKDYRLISGDDRIAVGVSGRKSSLAIAVCLKHLQAYSKVKFQLRYIFIDPGYDEKNLALAKRSFELSGLPVEICRSDIINRSSEADDPFDSCGSLIRKELLKIAEKCGCNKLALGQNFDDVIEDNFSAMVSRGKIECMMPRIYPSEDIHVEAVRPMYMVRESYLRDWVRYNSLELADSVFECSVLAENKSVKDKLSEIMYTKSLMERFRKTNPYIETNLFKCMYNVNLRTILSYTKVGKRYGFTDRYDSLADNYSGLPEDAEI